MPAWVRWLVLRVGRRALVIGLAAALIIGACTESSVTEPSDPPPVAEPLDGVSVPAGTSIGEAVPLRPGSALSRAEFSPVTEVPGEWLGGEALETGKVVAFIDGDGGPLALVGSPNNNHRVRPYALTDEGWQPTEFPISDPPEDSWKTWRRVSSVIAIGGTVVAVGPNDGARMDQPLSFIVGVDEAPRSPEDSTAGWTVVAKAVAGDGITIAIGQRDGQAVAWRSSDGLDWSEIPLPTAAGDSMNLIDVVFAGDRWAILGKQKGELVVMVGPEATDWQTSFLSFPPRVNKVGGVRLGHHGSSLHVIGTGQPRVGSAANNAYTWTSTDGVTWSAASTVPLEVFGDGHLRLRPPQSTSEATAFVGRGSYRSDVRYCFELEAPCTVGVPAIWVPDGDSWSMLVPPDGAGQVSAAAIIDGTLYVGTSRGGAIYQWTPDTSGELPRAAPLQIQPPVMNLPLASEARHLGPGVLYAWSLNRRQICPTVADEAWRLDAVTAEAADILFESHAVVNDEIYGTAELVDRNRIEFAIPGYGPVAYFEQLPNQGADADCGFGANL